jgi:hypothetical protein
MKFALVLITLTRTVEDARVSARVNRPHMMALKRRFMPKKAARSAYSKNLFEGERPNAAARDEDQDEVSSVVVLDYG